MKSILYITTNAIWSGSEELWVRSAKQFIARDYHVAFAARFEHPKLDEIGVRRINYAERGGVQRLFKKGLERYTPLRFEKKAALKSFIRQSNPDFVIISQGNPFQAIDVMQYCAAMHIPYVTVTQLAGEMFVWGFAEQSLPVVRQAYCNAKRNYFVSHHNLHLHNAMLGVDLANAEVVYNPCKLEVNDITPYPQPATDGTYDIGLVGRIDCWHKGYDLLLQVVSQEKWRTRPVRFNLYGSGPYFDYMNTVVQQRQLTNIAFKGHSNQIRQVWAENQILFMPSRMEGQALALIEAMYCQRAAIVTNVGGAAELIEEGYNGFIADIAAVEPIDAALERAWAQRDRWRELGCNAAATLKAKYPADAIAYFNERIEEELQGIRSSKSSRKMDASTTLAQSV